MITPEDTSDMIFVAAMGALAKQVSEIDYNRLTELVKNSPILTPIDEVGERIRNSLAVMAFAATTLQTMIPDTSEVRQSSMGLLSKIEPDQNKCHKIMEKMNDLAKEALQGYI